ncbi:hypothetical protein [uncultured Alistipes sp.]|uniref:hypothetical protein n=1 Tax=uncultured Alistipes sp. TaxID=538949 RepID=UPI00266EB776|nr:hypothetical protein [uncultured Alistipes sp.]
MSPIAAPRPSAEPNLPKQEKVQEIERKTEFAGPFLIPNFSFLIAKSYLCPANRRKWDAVREAALRTAGGNIKTFKNQ